MHVCICDSCVFIHVCTCAFTYSLPDTDEGSTDTLSPPHPSLSPTSHTHCTQSYVLDNCLFPIPLQLLIGCVHVGRNALCVKVEGKEKEKSLYARTIVPVYIVHCLWLGLVLLLVLILTHHVMCPNSPMYLIPRKHSPMYLIPGMCERREGLRMRLYSQ